MAARLAQSLGMIITSVGGRGGVPQAVNNVANKRGARVFILLLDSCAWVYACKLFLAAPHDRGMASLDRTMLDDDVPVLALVRSVWVS